MNEHATRGTLLFLGDSLTASGDWAAWFPEHDTRNHGVSGDTTDAVLQRLDAVVAEQPDAIALLVGTNDLAFRQSVEHIVRNIEYALVAIRRDLPGVRMLLQSILPRGREFADQIQDANRHLRQFAPSVHAQYLDLWPVLARRARRARTGVLGRRAAPQRAGLRGLAERVAPRGRPAGGCPADERRHPDRQALVRSCAARARTSVPVEARPRRGTSSPGSSRSCRAGRCAPRHSSRTG